MYLKPVAHVQSNEVSDYIKSLQAVPKSGVHNPLKRPERYVVHESANVPDHSTLCHIPAGRQHSSQFRSIIH